MRLAVLTLLISFFGGCAQDIPEPAESTPPQSLTEEQQEQEEIVKLANELCTVVEAHGEASSIKVGGEASAETDDLLKRFGVLIGLKTGVEFQQETFTVLREDLATAIDNSNNCSLTAFDKLVQHRKELRELKPTTYSDQQILNSYLKTLYDEGLNLRAGWNHCHRSGTSSGRNAGRSQLHTGQDRMSKAMESIEQLTLSTTQRAVVRDSLLKTQERVTQLEQHARQARDAGGNDPSTREECHNFMVQRCNVLLPQIDALKNVLQQ